MHNTKVLASGKHFVSKSKVGSLTRQIDILVREYAKSGGDEVVIRASKLSREREDLLKPEIIRSGRIRRAG